MCSLPLKGSQSLGGARESDEGKLSCKPYDLQQFGLGESVLFCFAFSKKLESLGTAVGRSKGCCYFLYLTSTRTKL